MEEEYWQQGFAVYGCFFPCTTGLLANFLKENVLSNPLYMYTPKGSMYGLFYLHVWLIFMVDTWILWDISSIIFISVSSRKKSTTRIRLCNVHDVHVSLLGWKFFSETSPGFNCFKMICFFAHLLLGCLYVMLIPEDQTCSPIEVNTLFRFFSGEDHREWEVGLNLMMICMVSFCWPLQKIMFLLTFLTFLTFLTGHWHPTYIIYTQGDV